MRDFCLIMVKFKEDVKDSVSFILDGKMLWRGCDGFKIIGQGEEEWDNIFIIKFTNPERLQNTINSLKSANLKDVKVISVKLVSSLKIKLLQFMMKKVLAKLPAIFTLTEDVDDTVLNSPIHPTKNQLAQLMSKNVDRPIDMLNFLKYKEHANYSSDETQKTKTDVSGKEAYNRYSLKVIRIVAKLGGCIQLMGKVKSPILGELDENWETFAIMRYPTRKTFQDMLRVRINESSAESNHRAAGLDKTKVIALSTDHVESVKKVGSPREI